MRHSVKMTDEHFSYQIIRAVNLNVINIFNVFNPSGRQNGQSARNALTETCDDGLIRVNTSTLTAYKLLKSTSQTPTTLTCF